MPSKTGSTRYNRYTAPTKEAEMNDVRLTRRGKIVLALAIIATAIGINSLVWGKNIACDWRGGSLEPCAVQPMMPETK